MFGLFKKKKKDSGSIRTILDSGNAEYADFVSDLYDELDRATRAHVLVAYRNLVPMLGALRTHAKNKGQSFSLDDFIVQCEEQLSTAMDEVNTRRYAWFMWAALLYRLMQMAKRDQGLTDALASAWVNLARDAPLLKTVLPNNVVWRDEEKEWFKFELRFSDPKVISLIINHVAPELIWPSPRVKELADEFGFHYSPNSTLKMCLSDSA